ncbi:FAD-dependent oxidoreductase [Microbacterium sp. CFBP9034]|uniref:FAD-dependent oxidoreductase n=1 Tax=Microbacterium sp. CFBP9034 TaxID=3096540 RepID=UPI002A6A5738|nr:FAD-dependent oxidoreductase [Microbacterium sp. CFBP9034]MDY0907904.1 FAD-dependent oxidoreductase [Microbacterium sp. CFBP9034]
MRIAVIGGGGSGLASAWLLEQEHDVTLFEADTRLGGHAHTVEVEVDGCRLAIDAGFQFFGAGPHYATFAGLLDALGVARSSYSATMSLTRTKSTQSVALPPFRHGRPVWASLTPPALADLIRFRAFLAGIPSFLARHDTTITTEEYIESRRLPASFTDRFLFPLLLALWCVDLPTFRSFAAYNTLHYLDGVLTSGLRPPRQLEIAGGMKVYVDALARDLARTDVRLGVGVHRLGRLGDQLTLDDTTGRRHAFDHVVIATNAEQAAALTRPVPTLAPVTRQLDRIEYFDTEIAVHGDRRLMPPRESAWSVVNARWDGEHSHLSVWNPERGLPVFRSWVTYEPRPPDKLYATAAYRHGKITPDYFDAQRHLTEHQGSEGVWIAGLYVHGPDSHESAIRSAVSIARRLAPGSARLALLDRSPGE